MTRIVLAVVVALLLTLALVGAASAATIDVVPTAEVMAVQEDGDLEGEAAVQFDQFTQWAAETGAVGAVASAIVTALAAVGLAATPAIRRAATLLATAVTTVAYIAFRDDVQIESFQDLIGTGFAVLVWSQAAYLAVTRELQKRLL